MTCANCGSAAVELVDESGATGSGPFTETWECGHCGARGTVTGDAAEPAQRWTRTGGVFD